MTGALANFIFQTINFVILALVLSWLFFKPVRRAIDERRASLSNEEAETATRLAEAKRAEEEANRLTAEMAAKLEAMEAAARTAAAEQAKTIIADAQAQIRRERDEFVEEQAGIIHSEAEKSALALASIAADLTRRLLTSISDRDLDAALLESGLCEFSKIGSETANKSRKSETVLTTAAVLDEPKRRQIEARLGTEVAYRVDPSLIAGVRIRGDFGLVDATVAGLSEYAAREIMDRLGSKDDDVEQRRNAIAA